MSKIAREKLKFQHTVKKNIHIKGKGLHTGKDVSIIIKPAPVNHGIEFFRTDLQISVPATPEFISELNFSTNLQNGDVLVRTVEHLMGALFILNVDNAIIDIDNEEVPILDGSAREYVNMIIKSGIKRQNALRDLLIIDKTFIVQDNEKYIICQPSDSLEIEYTIDFDHKLLKTKNIKLQFSPFYFIYNIAPARTFCFLKDIKNLRDIGLIKGGNLSNALVFGSKDLLNEERLPDEPLMHKLLDFIGDLYLLGRPVLGKFTIYKGGHRLHSLMTKKLHDHYDENTVDMDFSGTNLLCMSTDKQSD